jgi:hypothetical protein
MSVTTTKTNKPILPRGNDASPLGYNRAALYSGKALDFDGVNDYIDISNFSMSGQNGSFCFYYEQDSNSVFRYAFDMIPTTGVRVAIVIDNGQLKFLINNEALANQGEILNGEPNFCVITSEGTTQNFYINGQFIASQTSATFISLGTTGDAAIGSRRDGAAAFLEGQMSGFKIFNVALTAAQVADLYNNPEKVVPTGVDNTALKLWLPMQEGAGTYCINGADPLGDDLYNGAGSFDSATGWTLNTGFSIGGGSLSCDGSQTANTSAYYNISSVASSLVMVQFTLSNVTAGQVQLAFFGASGTTTKWYTADGTYTEYVEVQSGHNGNTGFIANADFVGDIDNLTLKVVNTGAISGATWTHGIGAPVAQTAVIDWNKETTGAGTTMLLPQGLTSGRDITGVNLFENVRKQGALNLDGNSWAEVHDNASLDITDAISVEAWVYFDGNGNKGVLSKWASSQGYLLYQYGSGLQFYINSSVISAIVSSNGWNHIVGTDDGTNQKIYLNGAFVTSTTSVGSIPATTQEVEIGRYNNAASTAHTNQIAQPRIYNRALTAEEVERNYNAGKNIYQ